MQGSWVFRLTRAFPLAAASTAVFGVNGLHCYAAYAESSPNAPEWRPAWQFEMDYRLEQGRELGSGGYGNVYLAMHKTGVSRAVKCVRLDDEQADSALRKEFEVMRRLQDCPHVVRVIDGYVGDTHRYMVMELCYGLDLVDSLIEELSEGTSSETEMHPNIAHVSATFREMVTAVAECHENGVAHMDVKPENFIHMSTESRDQGVSVKLLDFGLAWADVGVDCVESGTQLGCSKYLAPELFRAGTSVAPEPCDMYALGVSLFNLLTGHFPYSFGRIGRPRTRADLSHVTDRDAYDLISRLLATDPTRRPTAREVLEHPFIQKYRGAKVEPLSEFTEKSVKAFFTEESPGRIKGNSCACAVAARCPHRAVARSVAKGEVLFYEGSTDRAVYFVTQGCFKVKKQGATIATVGPQSVVGEMGALFERPRHATVVAAEDSEVFEFKDFGEKLGSTQQRYAVRALQEMALKGELKETKRDFLRRSTLFRDASEDLLSMIVAGSDHEFFVKDETVVQKQDDKMALYIVQEGLLEVKHSNNSYVALVGPGEIIGEMALVFGQRPEWHETITAVKPTTALVLDRSKFALILRHFPKERGKILSMAEWRVEQMGVGKGLLIARN